MNCNNTKRTSITNPMTTTRRRLNAKPLLVVGLCGFASLFCVTFHQALLVVSSPTVTTDRPYYYHQTSLFVEPPHRRMLRSKSSSLDESSRTVAADLRQYQNIHRKARSRDPWQDGPSGQQRNDSPKENPDQQVKEPNWWKDMDLRRDVARCGVEKCFFPSLSNNSVGYLVAGSSMLPVMKEAYDFAQYVQDEFGMRHFNMDPPRLLPASL